MSFKSRVLAAMTAAALTLPALPALAEGIMVNDPYARASTMMSNSGAAFMIVMNNTGEADRLIGAKSDVAERVELHTHLEDANGVMKMVHVEEGFELPEGGAIEMKRGGKHVMFLGITDPFEQGDMIPLTLVFEKAGEVQVEVPVDLERKPMQGNMNHGNMQMKGASSD